MLDYHNRHFLKMNRIELLVARQGRRRVVVIVIAAIIAVSAIALALWWLFAHGPNSDRGWLSDRAETFADTEATPPIPEPQLYKPLTTEEAVEANEELPFSTSPIERALPLTLPIDQVGSGSPRSAIDCLAAAIYYEAGSETLNGRKGVAQVVLNRVRHPAFPNTVCGVVYQGSERPTGCQFTFTCDGSLSRKPYRAGWDNARQVAIGAISGSVEPSVGMATHYHAVTVVPYWASSLDKIVKLGHHIFYRWKGSWGRRAAFNQIARIEQAEVTEPLVDTAIDLEYDSSALMSDQAVSGPSLPPSRIIADDVQETPSARTIMSPDRSYGERRLRADDTTGSLIVDSKAGKLRGE